jgi:hypothetical protein
VLFFITQVSLTFFLSNRVILSFFPIYAGKELITKVCLQGQTVISVSNGFMPMIVILLAEFLGFFILAYLVYRRKQSLL